MESDIALTGKLFSEFNRKKTQISSLHEVEFKIFSQWGDDGIIQYLIHRLDIPEKTFIEFGVENYRESNTRFLLINDNWAGLVMDSSPGNIQQIQNDNISWRHDLVAKKAFVTQENINPLLREANFTGEIGLLSIDIDGNDYWVWKAIHIVNPIIVIAEYNSVLGIEKALTIPYEKDFRRTDYHYSNLYFGCSLLALCDLAKEKGYEFIGCNSNGNNAYFIRKDKLNGLSVLAPEKGFVESKFRESRNREGKLTFIRAGQRIKQLAGMKLWNTREHKMEIIS